MGFQFLTPKTIRNRSKSVGDGFRIVFPTFFTFMKNSIFSPFWTHRAHKMSQQGQKWPKMAIFGHFQAIFGPFLIIFDPQNHSESFQTVFRWILGIIFDIFCLFQKIDFFTILARLGPQNVQKWPKWPKMAKMAILGHFWPKWDILQGQPGQNGEKWIFSKIQKMSKIIPRIYLKTVWSDSEWF